MLSCLTNYARPSEGLFAEVRNTEGELYKRTSRLPIRSGIDRYISKVHSFDITNDVEFKSSNEMFTSMLKMTQKEGKENSRTST
jgi:hypothetical protein